MDTKYLEVSDDYRIAYTQSFSSASKYPKPTILYLGGLCSSMNGTKASLISAWAEENDYPMVRFDYRGHGESSGEFTNFGIDHWAEDAIKVVDELIKGKILILGSSLGGWIAALLAKARTSRIMGLIGIAAAPDFTELSFRPKLSQEQKDRIHVGEIIDLPSGYPEPYRIGRALMAGGERCQVLNTSLNMPFPVRLFHGMDDQSVSIEHAIKFAQSIKSSDLELKLVKNADHGFSRDEDMQNIYTAIRALIKKMNS